LDSVFDLFLTHHQEVNASILSILVIDIRLGHLSEPADVNGVENGGSASTHTRSRPAVLAA